MADTYRSLPSIDRLVASYIAETGSTLPRPLLTALAREIVAEARKSLVPGGGVDLERLHASLDSVVRAVATPALRPVINGTGVIIHTNLGRAPLSGETRVAMDTVARGYTNLEFELGPGERGSRYDHLTQLLCRVTGAEDGIAVNNNASALILVLSCLTAGREVVISRSQAVEIGGGFRIPDILRQSGATLVEVGTTNRTYLSDFERAVGDATAALLRVHASNFRIRGFTTFPDLAGLVRIAHERGVLLLDDLGSGCLLPVEPFGLGHEPLVQESIQAGVDLAMFSGDKLLGGPQAGIIVGRRDLIRRLRAHPLARVLRLDKTTIAGLAATLLHFLRGEAFEKVPVWRMITADEAELRHRAQRLAARLGAGVRVIATRAAVGGGSLPDETLPSAAVAIDGRGDLVRRLRALTPAIIARSEHGAAILDLRTIDAADDEALYAGLRSVLDTANS